MEGKKYKICLEILRKQLVPASGCTEPIAVAYAAALASKLLSNEICRVRICVSPSILKNIKSVVVPNTNGLRGIEAAIAAGIVAGHPERKLEVLSGLSAEQSAKIPSMIASFVCEVGLTDGKHSFEIDMEVFSRKSWAEVRIVDSHTNVVLEKIDDRIVFETDVSETVGTGGSQLSMDDIWEFANECCIEDVKEILARQVHYNRKLSEEGLKQSYGANVGKVLLSMGNQVENRACALAAAGSDARMSGCELPAVINSGSGNQGITITMSLLAYAEELQVSEEQFYRALILANLIAIHIKDGIGCLSAYCGAVSAASAAGAGIAWLHGGNRWMVEHTLVNCLAILSGTICDGAKPSCAAKIASALQAAILSFHMAKQKQQFYAGEGILKKGSEKTIDSICELAREGMQETNSKILEIMLRTT